MAESEREDWVLVWVEDVNPDQYPVFCFTFYKICFTFYIGLHLLQNPVCAQHYDDSRFSILAQGRSPFHLYALEATFIKTSNPALCRQKEFVYSLKIVH